MYKQKKTCSEYTDLEVSSKAEGILMVASVYDSRLKSLR